MTFNLKNNSYNLLINGRWQPAQSGQSFDSFNPSDGVLIGSLAFAGKEDVDLAVNAARNALDGPWSKTSPADRESLLRRLGDLILSHASELARTETEDNGKPIWHTEAIDAPVAARLTYSASGWPSKIAGYTPPVTIPNKLVYTQREPVGVVAIIIPWNYPLVHTMQKLAPALACGNTVIFKPAEQASSATLRLGELIQEAGFADGVVNILTGDGPVTGAAIANHPGIDKIAFTGSVPAGQSVMRAAANNIKRISLELGNKAANIIFPDANLALAVQGSFNAAFGNTGQSCVAGSRLFVHEKIYEPVLSELVSIASKTKIGHAMDPETQLGPLIDQQQMDTVISYINSGIKQGATLHYGGEQLLEGEFSKGHYLTPAIFTGVQDDMAIACEEIFGPVVTILPFNSEEEVIARANNTPYGLAAGLWTQDLARAHRVAARLKSGVVWVNTYDLFDASTPFGGFKGSGFGRDNGRETIEAFTEVKAVWINTE